MEKVCPICNLNNNCQISEPASCWCMKQTLSIDLERKIVEKEIANMCICQKCLHDLAGK